jgi:hypothetical protein
MSWFFTACRMRRLRDSLCHCDNGYCVTTATATVPRPRVIDGAVSNDVATRTLIVRRPSHLSGYEAFLWRQAHEALVLYEERGGYVDTRGVVTGPIVGLFLQHLVRI